MYSGCQYSDTPGLFFCIHFAVQYLSIVWIGKGLHFFYVLLLINWYKRTKKAWKENTDICGLYSKWSASWNQVWKYLKYSKHCFSFLSNLSCIPVFYVLPTHTNIMANKKFNLFDKCAGRRVHLKMKSTPFLPEETVKCRHLAAYKIHKGY